MSEWFIARGGAQEGPLTAQQISEMLKNGELRAGEAHAWKEGLPDWKPLVESGVLAEASMSQVAPAAAAAAATPAPAAAAAPATAQPQFSQPTAAPVATVNPYSTPATTSPGAVGFQNALDYPGIGRLAYFGWQFLLSIITYAILFVVIFGAAAAESSGGMVGGFFLIMILGSIAGFVIAVKRVQNLGMSGWAVLWALVPFMNIWIGWRMFACPAGYHHHEQLDQAGKVLTGIMIGFIVLGIVANIFVAVSGAGANY